MNDFTRAEKLRIWMKRKGETQESISNTLGITRQTFIIRMKDFSFKSNELNTLRTLGAEV